jgi:hypothetical protein
MRPGTVWATVLVLLAGALAGFAYLLATRAP